jgi:hypothetical protein
MVGNKFAGFDASVPVAIQEIFRRIFKRSRIAKWNNCSFSGSSTGHASSTKLRTLRYASINRQLVHHDRSPIWAHFSEEPGAVTPHPGISKRGAGQPLSITLPKTKIGCQRTGQYLASMQYSIVRRISTKIVRGRSCSCPRK